MSGASNGGISPFTLWRCPHCGRATTVADWIARPICVHSWLPEGTPEVWDGNDATADDQPIELARNPEFRVPGPKTWVAMTPMKEVGRV